MSTVLWGGRRGDVQYGSRDFWRRNIPIDPAVMVLGVDTAAYMDVGDQMDILARGRTGEPDVRTGTVMGLDGNYVGLVIA